MQELAGHRGAGGLMGVGELGQQAGNTVGAREASQVFQFFAMGTAVGEEVELTQVW